MSVLQSTLKLTLLDNVSARARGIMGALSGMQRQQRAFAAPLLGMATRLAAFGGAYLGVTKGIGGTVGAAIEFESAFANVRKVLNGTDEQLDNVRRSVIAMSRELPISASGISEIYAAAGQANIPIQEINKFAEMVAKVSTAWEVPVAETGQALAEIKNQLQLGVSEVGLFADSLNHLSNNSAANAPKLLDFTKRVAANGEMFGYSAQESLAFGGSMIAMGAQSEVAATSFRNMGNALTAGTKATKEKRTAFARLGLDAVKTAKSMQKNALKTTLDVIDKIAELPDWERISVARGMFGDEARALMPVINNATELRRQLALVGDETNYAGSAFKEYIVKANTVGNVLQILQNKFSDAFRSIGDGMLPGIKEAALGVGDILDTLGERASVFDRMGTAMQAFLQGFGMDGGIRDVINDLGDLLFGEKDGSGAADNLGKIFVKFKEYGASVRELSDAIRENPIVKFLGEIAPYGPKLAAAAVGFGLMAGAIKTLGKALFFLSGASAAVGVIKTLAETMKSLNGGTPPPGGTPAPGGKPAPAAKPKSPGVLKKIASLASRVAVPVAAGAVVVLGTQKVITDLSKDNADEARRLATPRDAERDSMRAWDRQKGDIQYDLNNREKIGNRAGLGDGAPVRIDATSIAAMLQPSGVQQVAVTNPQPVTVSVHAPITITGVSNPEAAGSAAASELGAKTKAAVESSFGGGGGF